MKETISQIIQKHVDVFNFISVREYQEKRTALARSDGFCDYAYLEGYKTIITLAIPYPKQEVKWAKKGFGILSRYAYGTDYHIVFKQIIDQICEELEQRGIRTKGSVDISGVDERYAGYLSTMGFLGKNQFLILKEYGTYAFLGTILMDVDLEKNVWIQDDCGECTKCITACPSGALDDGFDQEKCISHLSQEKIPFTETEVRYFKTMIFGCDICQKVCPKNTGIDIHQYPEFEPSGIENIDLKAILQMSNKEYMDLYKFNASSWRGATVIKRNALCLIANQRLVSYKSEIEKSMVKLEDNLWYNKTAEVVLKILERT